MQYRWAKHIKIFHKDEQTLFRLGAADYKVGVKQLGDRRRYWALYLYKAVPTTDPTLAKLEQVRCLGHFSCTYSQIRRRCADAGVTFFLINNDIQ